MQMHSCAGEQRRRGDAGSTGGVMRTSTGEVVLDAAGGYGRHSSRLRGQPLPQV
jgi:hypothetical protein